MSAVNEPLRLTIGVTGHRDLLEAEEPAIAGKVHEFFTTLATEFPHLQLELITGLAAGADSLVAELALAMHIPVIAVLPFEQTEYEKDFEGEGELARFRCLLKQSRVLTLPALERSESEPGLTAGSLRAQHYAKLGVFLSNHCQILLALWDGEKNGELGGTHSVTQYHLTGVMPGWVSPDESPNLLADNENDLAYHIVCSRRDADGQADEKFEALQVYWVTTHFGRQSADAMPENYRQMFERLAMFSLDCARQASSLESSGSSLLLSPPTHDLPTGCERVDALYQSADWLAVRYQKFFSSSLLLSHVLAVSMGLVFVVYSEMLEVSALAWTFLGLFGLGTVLHLFSEKREWHRKYLDYRALAEGLRVQLYWGLAGVVDAQKAEFAYDNFLQKQDVDLSWIRHVMRSASLQSYHSEVPDPRWLDWVGDRWVGQATPGDGQLAYYESKALHRSRTYRRTVLLGSMALWVGVSMAAFLGQFATRLNDQQAFALVLMMGVLPLIAGVRDAYSHKKADKELIKQYQFMAKIFSNARRLLDNSDDPAFRRRVLRAVGAAALEEHAEWLLMHRERPLERSGIQ